MNLVRAGHLHTPLATPSLFAEAGDCSTATVAHVHPQEPEVGLTGEYVNVSVLDHEGLRGHGRSNVEVRAPRTEAEVEPGDILEGATFHLSGDCPWKR